jgi:hypothetical protein
MRFSTTNYPLSPTFVRSALVVMYTYLRKSELLEASLSLGPKKEDW